MNGIEVRYKQLIDALIKEWDVLEELATRFARRAEAAEARVAELTDEIAQHDLWREEAYRQITELKGQLEAARIELKVRTETPCNCAGCSPASWPETNGWKCAKWKTTQQETPSPERTPCRKALEEIMDLAGDACAMECALDAEDVRDIARDALLAAPCSCDPLPVSEIVEVLKPFAEIAENHAAVANQIYKRAAALYRRLAGKEA